MSKKKLKMRKSSFYLGNVVKRVASPAGFLGFRLRNVVMIVCLAGAMVATTQGSFAQSTIYVCYDYPHKLFPIPIKINNQEVFTLYAKQKKTCTFHSEGKVMFSFDVLCVDPFNKPPAYRYQWADEIQLTLSRNSVHYIKISNKGMNDVKFEILSEEAGKKEFAKKKYDAHKYDYVEPNNSSDTEKSGKEPQRGKAPANSETKEE